MLDVIVLLPIKKRREKERLGRRNRRKIMKAEVGEGSMKSILMIL